MTERGDGLKSLIDKVTGEVKRVLEKVQRGPIEKTTPVIVQPSSQIPEGQSNEQVWPIPDTKYPDRIFQMGIVGLGICFIGLVIGGLIYLIILWVMR